MRAWGLGYLTDLITDSQPKSAIINRITEFRFKPFVNAGDDSCKNIQIRDITDPIIKGGLTLL